jgi:hypothetical protein
MDFILLVFVCEPSSFSSRKMKDTLDSISYRNKFYLIMAIVKFASLEIIYVYTYVSYNTES